MAVEIAGYLGLGLLSAVVAGALKEDAPVVITPLPTGGPSPTPTPSPTPKPTPTPTPAPAAGNPPELAAFIAKYTGKWIDWDHAYGAQCCDLANLWAVTLGIETFGGDAWAFQYDPHPDTDWIANTATNYPSPGDVVVWHKSSRLPFGHVAVARAGSTSMRLTTFDQNWPLNAAAHNVDHTYTDVAGWHHPRKLPRSGRGGAYF